MYGRPLPAPSRVYILLASFIHSSALFTHDTVTEELQLFADWQVTPIWLSQHPFHNFHICNSGCICRRRRIGQIDNSQTDEDHPRDGLLAGGVRGVPTRRLQQHRTEFDGHNTSDGPAKDRICGSCKNRHCAPVLYTRLGRRRGHPATGDRAADEEALVGRWCAAIICTLARISAERLGWLLSELTGPHRAAQLHTHTAGCAANTCEDHRNH